MSPNSSALSFDCGQLDLFAESEAADEQRRLDAAPTLFDTQQRGYFTRIAAAKQWVDDHGHFDCHRRSHAWHPTAVWFDKIESTPMCRPAVLTAALYCNHYESDCFCVGDTVYRGACLRLHCTWEGPDSRLCTFHVLARTRRRLCATVGSRRDRVIRSPTPPCEPTPGSRRLGAKPSL